jgi:hypothetical protein
VRDVVEHDEGVRDQAGEVGRVQIIGRRLGQALDRAHQVVCEIADESAAERLEARRGREPKAREHAGETVERVTFDRALSAATLAHDQAAVLRTQRQQRIGAENAVASPTLAALDALQEKAVAAAVELQERRDRCVEIGGDLPIHGDRIGPARQAAELVEVGLQAHRALE